MDCVLYQIFQIISSISSKKHQKVTDNLIENRKQKQKIEIENKIENWITFKNKAAYDILTPDTIKLLASTEKKKIPKNENRKMYLIQKSLKSIMILLTMVINMIRESFVLSKNKQIYQ